MNNQRFFTQRKLALLLVILLLLPLLAACGRKQDAVGSEPTLTVSDEGKLTFSLRLGSEDLKAHEGQVAYLYELKPGETVYDINKKSAMLQNYVASKIRFSFPLLGENGEDRRCNTYLLTFSDGTVYSKPISLSEPEVLATQSNPTYLTNDIKGMPAGYEELASTLHASHSVISLSASELLSGEMAATWNGVSLAINQTLIEQADGQALAATRAGLQLSLELTVGAEIPVSDCVALINWLLERYSNPETGMLTGLILLDTSPSKTDDEFYTSSVERMSSILRCAKIAMASRVENGGVFLGATVNQNHLKQYLSDVLKSVQKSIRKIPGVALYPLSTTAALTADSNTKESEIQSGEAEATADTPLLLSDLPQMTEWLRGELGRDTEVAILGLAISAENPDLQAALCAYAYRAARSVQARLLAYATPADDATGLYDTDGIRRRAADCFDLMDTDENLTAEALASELLGKEWTALKTARSVRASLTGLSNLGFSEELGKRYFDFSEGDPMGFVAAGGASAPAVTASEALNTNVLVTSIAPKAFGAASGIRCNVKDVKEFKDAHVLSASVMPQSPRSEYAEITLRLEGRATDGTAISLTSSITLACNAWQTPSFQIREFTARLDENTPCSMTLTMSPIPVENAEGTESSEDSSAGDVLGLHSVSLRSAEPDRSWILLVAMIGGGFAVGFSVVLILLSLGKKKRARKQSA